MAQLQWLGTIPKDDAGGYLARALGEGVSSGVSAFTEGKLREEEMRREEDLLKTKYDAMDHSKKVEVAKMAISIYGKIPNDDKKEEFLNDPEIKSIFDSAGIPLPSLPSEAEVPQTEVDWFDPRRLSPRYSHSGKPQVDVNVDSAVGSSGGYSEEDIQFTMKKRGLSREEVLRRLAGNKNMGGN